MRIIVSFLSALILLFGCASDSPLPTKLKKIPVQNYKQILDQNPNFWADSFEFPVGSVTGRGYYQSLSFGEPAPSFGGRYHLGEDWNSRGGRKADYKMPIFVIGNGIVTFARDIGGGWGKVVIVLHRLSAKDNFSYVESVYAHMEYVEVKEGELKKRGDYLGAIGDANGRYSPHLHFEMRHEIGMPVGGGYSFDTSGYLNPTEFLEGHFFRPNWFRTHRRYVRTR